MSNWSDPLPDYKPTGTMLYDSLMRLLLDPPVPDLRDGTLETIRLEAWLCEAEIEGLQLIQERERH